MLFINLFIQTIAFISNYTNNKDYVNYLVTYNKSYTLENYNIFLENKNYIDQFNSNTHSFELDINHLADEKMMFMSNFKQKKKCHNCFTLEADNDIPKSIDWRNTNKVTDVKDQGQCGGCWAFSTTGAVEGITAITDNNLVNASEQELIDCSTQNNGCNGGIMDKGFEYVIENGLCSEDSYPYQARDGMCHKFLCKQVASIDDFRDVQPNNENFLKYAVASQPVSVAIQANLSSFRFYKKGVYQDENCGTNLDHGVLVVGYGEEMGLPYWLVKNSWSTKWGDNGYIKILRNYKENTGMCGIAMQPSFPIKN